MSESDEWEGINETPLCVTLERDITIPGKHHEPNQLSVFRARERSVADETTSFFGVIVGPDNTVVEVSNDNIRSVVHLGSYSGSGGSDE